MLKIMRKNAGSWLIKVLFIIIVVVFIFWGVGTQQDNKGDRVAVVNGEAISVESFQTMYDNAVENLRRQYGDRINRDVIKMFQIPQQVMNTLVNRQLMLQEAEKLEIRVGDEELADAIQSMAEFQEAGVFNNRRYNSILSRVRLTPEAYEASKRQDMIINKLSTFLTSGVKVTDGEILDMYEWQNSSVDIDYVLFSPNDIKDPDPTGEELQSYYETNKESYETEPKLKVRYLAFRPDRFVDDVTISDEEIQEYYDMHPSEFEKEKTVEARHILLKVDKDAAPELVDEKRKKAEEIAKAAREGKDFAELAKEFSEGPTREAGGLLGEFKKGDMVAPFSNAAFAMAPGEISEPVRTQFGWHVIKVEKVNDAALSPLEDVAADIREKLTREASKSLAYDKAEDAYDRALNDEDLEKTAADLDIELQSTDFFTEKGPETGFSDPALFASTAFELSDFDISDVLNIGDNYFILQKADAIPASIPDLADVKDAVRSDLVKKMKDERARENAEEFLALVKEGSGMETAAKDAGFEVHNSGFFKRSASIPDIGYKPEISQAAFLLSDAKKVADTVYNGEKGYYVIQFKARKAPDVAELDDQKKETLKEQLAQKKQEDIFNKWISSIKATSDIRIEEGYLD
jgi:peptidyl-prolyl cis-trans isomerase D